MRKDKSLSQFKNFKRRGSEIDVLSKEKKFRWRETSRRRFSSQKKNENKL